MNLNNMESVHLKNLFNSLLTTIVSVIKEKLVRFNIEISNNKKLLLLESHINTNFKKPIRVVQMNSKCLTLSDGTSLEWEKIQNFQD